MDRLWDLIVGQLREFNEVIGPDNNLGVCLPGLHDGCFLPKLVEDFNPQVIIFHGELETGEQTRVVFDQNSFPLILTAIPKPKEQPKRIFGFQKRDKSACLAGGREGRPEKEATESGG